MPNFYDLPAELRDLIYQKIAELDGEARIKRHPQRSYCNQVFATKSMLIATNKRINQLYYAAVLEHAFSPVVTAIHARIKGCNMHSIIHAIFSCTKAQIATLEQQSLSKTGKLVIEMELPPGKSYHIRELDDEVAHQSQVALAVDRRIPDDSYDRSRWQVHWPPSDTLRLRQLLFRSDLREVVDQDAKDIDYPYF